MSGPKRKAVEERFWDKVEKDGPILLATEHLGPCWIWTAYRSKQGYGRVGDHNGHKHVVAMAYRVSYKILVGEIPTGLELDHLCRNPSCVNPSHLDPVTSHENTIVRGVGLAAQRHAQTHCIRGHPLSGDNLQFKPNGNRICKTCARMRDAKKRETKKRRAYPSSVTKTRKHRNTTNGERCLFDD